MEDKVSSVEKILAHRFGLVLLTAVAPAAWGTTYIVTEQLLPPDRPLFGALVRALPVGLVMLAWRRRLPRGDWWWKATVMGLCNIGAFFPLIFLAAYHLPGGLAATIQATAPLAVMALAWPLIGERPARVRVGAALMGLVGVTLLVLRNPDGVTTLGLAGALGSVLVSALGFVLMKRWTPPVDMLTLVSWQLVVGGLALLPLGLVLEGAPPAIDLAAALATPGSRWWAPAWPTSAGSPGCAPCPPAPSPSSGWSTPSSVRRWAWSSPASPSGGSRRSAWRWCSAACCSASAPPGGAEHPATTPRSTATPCGTAADEASRPHEASRPREALRPLEAPRPAAEPVAAKMGR